MDNFDLKKYLGNNPLTKEDKENLKEGLTWENRKEGERLPTMEDYQEAYNKTSINEEYSFDDANVDKAKKAQKILTPKIGPQIEKLFKSLENDQEIEELEAGSAEYGLAIGLIAQKVIMDSINEEQYNSDK